MPNHRPFATLAASRAILKLRAHSRDCHCIEARRALIATERWMMQILIEMEATGPDT